MNFEYIDSDEHLIRFCESLHGERVLALDTEFIREKTYYPQLCLLQVATPEQVACIDPLSISQLEPLWQLLLDTSRLKVLHAARQDLEIFYHLFKELPKPVFDTQLAATVLGYGEQIGYAALVKKELDIDLAKGHARTDWQQRPLSDEQLEYAADDVRYLIRLYPVLQDKLVRLNRQDWLQADFDSLTKVDLYETHLDDLWQRIGGHQRLKGQQLAVLQALAKWREQVAQQSNKPRRWILSDDLLIALAQHPVKDLDRLKRLRGLTDNFINRHGDKLVAVTQEALQTPKQDWPVLRHKVRLSGEQEALADCLMGLIRLRAVQNSITPSLITTKKHLEKLIQGERDLPLLKGWRATVAGNDILAFLDGSLALRVQQQHLGTQTSGET